MAVLSEVLQADSRLAVATQVAAQAEAAVIPAAVAQAEEAAHQEGNHPLKEKT